MIIGIGGISRGGKSFLAGEIAARSSGIRVVTISQDEFVLPESQIPKIRNHIDWETPASIDFERYRKTIREAAKDYDRIIAEGLFAFNDPETNKLYDKRIHIALSFEEFKARKRKDLRWGKEPDWYIQHIWDSYLKYGIPETMDSNILRLDGNFDFDFPKIMEYLNDAGKQKLSSNQD